MTGGWGGGGASGGGFTSWITSVFKGARSTSTTALPRPFTSA